MMLAKYFPAFENRDSPDSRLAKAHLKFSPDKDQADPNGCLLEEDAGDFTPGCASTINRRSVVKERDAPDQQVATPDSN